MREIAASLYGFVTSYLYWLHVPKLGVIDIVEIVIIALFLYYLIKLIKGTRVWTLFKGILIILLFVLIAAIFQMNTILWLFGRLLNFGIIALLIIFQPELRRALERLGRNNPLTMLFKFDFSKPDEKLFSDKTINEMVRACVEMGKNRTGALIVIERGVRLDEYVRTGIVLDSVISSQLILNIFEHNTPLHDGAVIMRGDRFVAATCYLPLSDNRSLSKDLGTRHRAAVGISEVSDAVTVVVSEETGGISVAQDGMLTRNMTGEDLKTYLKKVAGSTEKPETLKEKLKRRRRSHAEKDIETSDK